MSANLQTLLDRLEKVTERLEKASASAGSGSAVAASSSSGEAAADAPFVVEFDNYVNDHFAPFLALSDKIGGAVKDSAAIFKAGMDKLRDFLVIASQAKQPAQGEMAKIVTPINEQVAKADDFSRKAKTEFVNHLMAVGAGMPALGWILIEKTPAPYVLEMLASGEFYSNKVLVAYKGKDQTHIDWAKAFKVVFVELAAYVKKFHTTGVSWNKNGKNASEVSVGSKAAAAAPAAAPAPSAGGPPPPPPPPPPPVEPAAPAAAPASAALFAEINSKGDGVTSGLRHVTKDMKTKNMPKQEPIQPAAAPKSAAAPKAAATSGRKTGTPKFQLDGSKWLVEYQDGNKSITIDETELKQTVYIYRCYNSVIVVSGKVNALTFDECEKCALVFENAVSSCELVNCKSVEVQVKGRVPSITLDKCSAVQVYLSKDCLDVDIVTSKSDAMNVLVPDEGEDMLELPVAEQFLTKWDAKSKKLITKPNSHV